MVQLFIHIIIRALQYLFGFNVLLLMVNVKACYLNQAVRG